MKYPSFDQYQSALQSPKTSFRIPVLQNGSLEKDLWGFPRVRSGGFALTYKLWNDDIPLAVRCFHKDVDDRSYRYGHISDFLSANKSPFFIPITYHHKGVNIEKNIFPITIMKWLEGDTLETYINQHNTEKTNLAHLAEEFVEMVNHMQAAGIAHGDLSHQNIIVNNSHLTLVDYDGMYVPRFQGLPSNEIGHSNFQHPSRDFSFFNSEIDRFSSIVIYLALKALSCHPDLWPRFENGGDGILFRRADFVQPYQSALLQEIETMANFRDLIYLFRKICLAPIVNVPTLSDFLTGNVTNLPRDEISVNFRSNDRRDIAFDASRRLTLMTNLGKVVTVVGQVTEVFEGMTRDGEPHYFLNFGNWKGRCFTAVIWSDALKEIKKEGFDIGEFVNKWVSTSGVLTSYKHRPQIAFSSLIGFEVLSGEDEAKNRLGEISEPDPITHKEQSTELIYYQPKLFRFENGNRDNVLQNTSSVNLEQFDLTALPNKPLVMNDKMNNYQKSIQRKIDSLYSSKIEK